MDALVETLKRLYKNGEISIEKINELLEKKTINQNEYMYILN